MKDNRLKIGVDVDGVLSNFIHAYRDICVNIVGHFLPIESLDWDQSNWEMTKKQHKEAWKIVADTADFYYKLPVLGESRTFNLKAFNEKHRLYFITTRPNTAGEPIEIQTAAWLSEKFQLEYPTVIVAANKGPIAAALELDYFIDDKPENLYDVYQYSYNTQLFLKDQPWNRDSKYNGLPRVYDLGEFAAKIKEG